MPARHDRAVPDASAPAELRPFSIVAANLPEHARNAIHTDAGAQAAGFPRALVAGVTTYAYLTHPLVDAWGEAWLAGGSAEIRFRSPVFDGETLDCVPTRTVDDENGEADGVRVEALIGTDTRPRVVVEATLGSPPMPAMRAGEPLRERTIRLDGELGADYGWRAGDHDPLFRDRGLIHPAVWPAIANIVVHADVARGAWVHTRSIIRHHALVRVGVEAAVRSVVVRRFESHGERAVLDVEISVDGRVVATLEHEAIVALPA